MAEYKNLEPRPLLEQAWCFYSIMTGVKYKYNLDPISIDEKGGFGYQPTFYFHEIDTYGFMLPTPFNSTCPAGSYFLILLQSRIEAKALYQNLLKVWFAVPAQI